MNILNIDCTFSEFYFVYLLLLFYWHRSGQSEKSNEKNNCEYNFFIFGLDDSNSKKINIYCLVVISSMIARLKICFMNINFININIFIFVDCY